MNNSSGLKGSSFESMQSKQSSVSSVWVPSPLEQRFSNDQSNPTTTNKLYRTELIINQTPITSISSSNYCRCHKCKCLIDGKNESEMKFNDRYYHVNCFKCIRCSRNVSNTSDNKLKINDDGEPICFQCRLSEAKICHICHSSILDESSIIFDTNNYHKNCFKCNQCQNSLINEINVRIHNLKIYCNHCYNQNFEERCQQCQLPITDGKSTIYEGRKYHPECFRCEQCFKTILDKEFTTHNCKPCCIHCYETRFASQCAQCFKPICIGKSILFKDKKYHPECFQCVQCKRMIIEKEFPTHNSKPCCDKCYDQYFAPQCAQCLRPISAGQSIIHKEKKYHPDCFRCCQCNKVINDPKFTTLNSKPCCIPCHNQYLLPTCAQCFKIISNGRSITYHEKTFHPDCFRCGKCNQIINESKFHTENNKPYCVHCYNQYFTPRCFKCSKSIINKYTTFQGKNFHIDCFVCAKCRRIIDENEKIFNDQLDIICSRCAL